MLSIPKKDTLKLSLLKEILVESPPLSEDEHDARHMTSANMVKNKIFFIIRKISSANIAFYLLITKEKDKIINKKEDYFEGKQL
jgi:hypothetical protein